MDTSGATDKASAIDVRPLLVMPGLVDLHAHLPQWPNAGLGAGLDLLTWLQRYIFPLEREFHAAAARRLAPLFYNALAGGGHDDCAALRRGLRGQPDVAFEAAHEHGIRLVLGKVMMDRLRYDESLARQRRARSELAQSQRLIERWHGRDDGRLQYAVTPRFASAARRRCCASRRTWRAPRTRTGRRTWPRIAHEIDEVAQLFPEARDYTDVYDRAGALGRARSWPMPST